jgi:dolichyl-phosphate-mannose-protein mannosyltransferase
VARSIGLIVVPFIIYLSFFYIHFKILVQSGPGDTFMSPAFQETLSGNEMLLNSQGAFFVIGMFENMTTS